MEKNRKKQLIFIIAGCAVAVAAVTCLVIFKFAMNDKTRLAKAFSKLAEDEEKYSDIYGSSEELQQITESLVSGNSSIHYSANISGLEGISATIGLDGDIVKKSDDRLLSAENMISAMNIDIAEVDVYSDGSLLYITVPELLDYVFTLDADHPADDFNSSVLSQYSGMTLPDELNVNLFDTENVMSTADTISAAANCIDEINALKDAITVKRDSKKNNEDFTDDEGEVYSCRVYHVVVPATEANALAEKYFESNVDAGQDGIDTDKIRTEEDIPVKVLVDEGGYVREIAFENAVTCEDCTLDMDIAFEGSNIETDVIEIKTEYTDDAQSVSPELKLERNMDGNYELTMEVSGDMDVKAEISGNMTYDRDDKRLTGSFEQFKAEENGEDLFRLTGNYTVIADVGDDVSIPDENLMPVDEIGLMDLLDMATQLSSNSGIVSQALEALGY